MLCIQDIFLFFYQPKKFGDELIVVIATDKNYEKVKLEKPKFNQKKRKATVESLNVVDKSVIGYENDTFKIIKKIKPDIICLGYDRIQFTDGLQEKLD